MIHIFPYLHGGAGFYLSDDYLGGIVNDLRGGFSYAYFLQAGKDLFINAGLSASVYHRGYNFGNAVLPDQIDPLGGVSFPSSEMLVNFRERQYLILEPDFFLFPENFLEDFLLIILPNLILSASGYFK